MMQLPRMTYKWRVYFHGLFASMISGAANSGVVMWVDPEDFNFHSGLGKLGAVSGAAAISALLTYLKTHPLPDIEKDTDYYRARQQKLEPLNEDWK